MSVLKAQLPWPVRSLGELFAIALTLETEAAARYAELADNMRALGLPEVGAVFDRLVAEEAHHAEEVERWSREAVGAPVDPGWLRWQPSDAFDEEAAQGIASSHLASAYRALSFAVRNEERAFLLWTHIAAQAEDPAVRQAAEAVAIEELRHAALLRRERRRAFHAARAGAAAREATAPEIEWALAAGLAALARAPALAAWSAELQRLAAEAQAMAGDAAAEPATAEPDLEAMRRLAERAAELYLEAADTARDEGMLLHLQSQAAQAIGRIARLAAVAAG